MWLDRPSVSKLSSLETLGGLVSTSGSVSGSASRINVSRSLLFCISKYSALCDTPICPCFKFFRGVLLPRTVDDGDLPSQQNFSFKKHLKLIN
ncbi:hypothetical protein Hanom_Chr16g01475961 [Helianthus anomalus]